MMRIQKIKTTGDFSQKRFFYLIKGILFPFLLLVLIYSCSLPQKIPIQVAVPPQHPLSSDIQSLAILDRSITRKFTNLKTDSLESILLDSDFKLDTLMYDGIAADTAIQVAAKALFESDRFDVVVPKQRNIPRKDEMGLPAPLDQNFIAGICKDFNVNAVLVLESFKEKVMTNVKAQKYNLGFENYKSTYSEYNGTINVAYDLIWRLYQPDHNPPILRINTNDTIFWNSFEYVLQDMYEKLPSLKEALIGGGIAAGVDIARNISPQWVDESRRYYKTGKREIDAAIPLIKENKWEEAAAIWKKYQQVSSKSLRSKIEFNLAVAAEMMGDIDAAIEWAKKSYATKYSHQVENYLKYLDQRRNLLRKSSKIQVP